MRYLYIILLFFAIQTADAQRLIRRNSRHYIAQSTLPNKVDPLLTDEWDQFEPYNSMCPADSTGERSAVGCVATAMSQVMHYWQWPERGRGSYTYEDSIGCHKILTANFSEHTYDWANMLDKYEEGKYSKEQADAVALLSLDCGISVNMRYGYESSGANSIYQPLALAEYFGYDRGVQQYYRDFYSLDEITLILKQELAAGRPVLISAHNLNGGHAFVIDGYDERDWFHTRWGNPGGEDDSYTYLPNMVPNQPQWYDPHSPENGFNLLQMFTIGIMPENHKDAKGIERHHIVFKDIKAVTDSTMEKACYHRNDVRLTIHDMGNLGWNILSDSISIMLRKDGEIICPLYTYNHELALIEIDDTTYTDSISVSIPEKVGNGTYTIMPMFRDNHHEIIGEKEWKEARTCVGTPNYLIATVNGDEVTLFSDTTSTSLLTLEDIDFPDMLCNATAPQYTFKLRNHGPEMAGRIYFLMESIDGGKDFILQKQGISIGADEAYTIDNHLSKFWAPQLGKFRLRLLYENNLFADELMELELPEEMIITVISVGQIEIARR